MRPIFSTPELFNYKKMKRTDVRSKLTEAMSHVRFCFELCLEQHVNGRLFIFEHPAEASSWGMRAMQQMRALDGVRMVKFDFCMLGMKTVDEEGKEAAARKRTRVMTNSNAVTLLLQEAQCRSEHKHQHLLSNRAGPCQEYTDEFCRLICEAIMREKDTVKWKNDMKEVFDITKPFAKLLSVQQKLEKLMRPQSMRNPGVHGAIGVRADEPAGETPSTLGVPASGLVSVDDDEKKSLMTLGKFQDSQPMATPAEEDQMDEMYRDVTFVDDVTGSVLDKEKTIEARIKEMQFFRSRGVYTKVKREGYMKIIKTRWLDINKGDSVVMNLRSRLVGCEFAKEKRDDLFAATPPLESMRTIMALCASNQNAVKPEENYIIMSNDVSRAYFYAPTTRAIYIEIPQEDWEVGDETRVAKLNLSLYGTRDAAMNWAKKYTDVMVGCGFERGIASPCNFYHRDRKISVTVHGDDYTSTGTERDLKWFEKELERNFEIKTELLGPNTRRHQQEIRVLNRVLGWTANGLTFEADQRHAEILINELGVRGCKPVATPGAREDVGKASMVCVNGAGAIENTDDEGLAGPLLTGHEATKFRALAARANYLAQDRIDIQYAVKEIARRMATPRQGDMLLLKRLARYLVGAPRAIYTFQWRSQAAYLDVFVDSDWAGCKGTRRSTSGGIVTWGGHVLKSWATTQATVALSSAEAELYSLVKGAGQALGMMAVARDLGMALEARVHTDASATLGIVQRQGLGKLRHISTQFLWIQDKVRNKQLEVVKVPGKDNPADILTKNVPAEILSRHLRTLRVSTSNDRATSAPQLSAIAADVWKEDPEHAVRLHLNARRALFTPLRVQGSPPTKALTPQRTTRGTFLNSGEEFVRIDAWTSRATAHLELKEPWVGSTEFTYRTDWIASRAAEACTDAVAESCRNKMSSLFLHAI